MIKIDTYDVIITTNNRAESVKTLVEQLLNHSLVPESIIIVDSSLEEDLGLQEYEKVRYIRASHANQPYQRYVGYMASTNALLVYLDDDMEIADKETFTKILRHFNEKPIIGLAINFVNDNEFLHKKVPKSKFVSSSGYRKSVLKVLKTLSGQTEFKSGMYGYNGLKGSQPKEGGMTEWFSGGSFAVKREFLYEGFNFKLFELYEKGLGKGEDGIIGYTLSKVGPLEFEPEILFIHNDKKDSTYTQNLFSFSRRVIYSRLYLSCEFCRLSNKPQWKAIVYYHWYVLWRVVGMVVNQILNYQESRKEMLRGYLAGWKLAWMTQRELTQYKDEKYWYGEAKRDINA